MEKSLNGLPEKHSAHGDQTDRVEDVCRCEKSPGDALRQDKCQIDEHESHFVRQIMHAVHKQAETLSLEARNSLNDKDCCVERDGCCYSLAMVGHTELLSKRGQMDAMDQNDP